MINTGTQKKQTKRGKAADSTPGGLSGVIFTLNMIAGLLHSNIGSASFFSNALFCISIDILRYAVHSPHCACAK